MILGLDDTDEHWIATGFITGGVVKGYMQYQLSFAALAIIEN